MKTPICGVCLNSDMLCRACKLKLDSGLVTESEIKVSKIFNNFSNKFKTLRDVTIKRVIEGENIMVVICERGNGPKIVGKNGVIIKKISDFMGKSLRVVEETTDVKEFVQNLIYPVPVLALNVIYRPESEVLKIVIPGGMKIPISRKSLNEIMKQAFGKECLVSSD